MSLVLAVSLMLAQLLTCLTAPTLHACVGKTLLVGSLEDPQQQILAQMLSILISERTGTSIKIVPMEGHAEAHEALGKGKCLR